MAKRGEFHSTAFGVMALLLVRFPAAGQTPAPNKPVAKAPPAPPPLAQTVLVPERIDAVALGRIREEAFARSHVLETARYFTDVTGPRLTGSTGLRLAQAYARDRLKEWGLPAASLESWGPFGRGWSLEGFTINLTAPNFSPLIGYPKAWSPSTAGLLRGEPVLFDAHAAADLERYRGKLKGRIVLLAGARAARPLAAPQRLSDSDLLRLANAAPPARGGPQVTAEQKAAADLDDRKWRLLYGEGPAVVLEPGAGENGTVAVAEARTLPVQGQTASQRVHAWDPKKAPVLPQVVLAVEHFNRLARLAASGAPLKVEVQVTTRYHDEDLKCANVIAEIPGADLKDEVVMLGASLDSWHSGTGATDNAAGAAVAMEAMRILMATGLRPRRTLRVALWSAGEQGSLGSQAYVAAHFGKRTTGPDGVARVVPGPDHGRLAGYFNLDGGGGRIRGVYLQGNEAVRPVFRAWLAPFADLGATTLTSAGVGDSDHVSYDAVGLPGFQFLRDFMESGGPSPTNMDVFDRLQEDDLKQSATLAASFAFLLANRDQKLPRKAAGTY
jgi:hypothetical protein